MSNTYTDIIRSIITSTVKFDGLTDEEKTELVDFLEDNCILQIHIDLLKGMSKKDRDLFYEISEHRNPDRIEAYLREKVPDYRDVIEGAARNTIQEFIRLQQS